MLRLFSHSTGNGAGKEGSSMPAFANISKTCSGTVSSVSHSNAFSMRFFDMNSRHAFCHFKCVGL